MISTGFPYSADKNSRILILGSMPSRESLRLYQYYGHPRNAFWPIMGELFAAGRGLSYEKRLEKLRQCGVALWDVAHRCHRSGSMDHAIEIETVVPNDFTNFFRKYSGIRALFFNGRKAEELYRRKALPELPAPFNGLPLHTLPSTSPAHAALDFAAKVEAWRIITLPEVIKRSKVCHGGQNQASQQHG